MQYFDMKMCSWYTDMKIYLGSNQFRSDCIVFSCMCLSQNCRCSDKRRSYLADYAECNNGSSSFVRMFQSGFFLAAISEYPYMYCACEPSILVVLSVWFWTCSVGLCLSWVLLLWPPYVVGQAIIFLPCGFCLLLLSIFFSSPNLSGHRVDVYHTSTHGVALVRI